MAIYINSPQWFYGIDSAIEVLSIIVALFICIYSYKIYKISSEKKYLAFSSAFFLVGFSYVFKIISEIVIYSRTIEQSLIGPFLVSKTIIEPVTWIHTYSHTTFRVLLTFAFFMLLVISYKMQHKSFLILTSYLLLCTVIFAHFFPPIFHLTHTVILGLLIAHYYNNYLAFRSKQSLLVMLAFTGILISHLLQVFMQYSANIYAIGEGFQLMGFGFLIYAFILVKKK